MEKSSSLLKPLATSNTNKIFLGIIVTSLILGSASGIYLAQSKTTSKTVNSDNASTTTQAKTAGSDTQTFRDFAEGVIEKRPEPKNSEEYLEGTHLLKREDNPIPVALTSSVVDLSEYEGKKVKVYGETQKAIKAGWLMDVGKVELRQ